MITASPRIVIASDKFKGSLSSSEVADTIEQAIRSFNPSVEVVKIPVSDGGDGLIGSLVPTLKGSIRSIPVVDPLMRPIGAGYGILPDRTAVIELAAASGLTLLAPEERNPWITTTYGTGQQILDALEGGATDILLGIGGSATNDAATGLLQALGFRFLDSNGDELGHGGQVLSRIASVDSSRSTPLLKKARIQIACDVDNPLAGVNGAACVFARQKGADEEMIRLLDQGLVHWASVLRSQFHRDIIDLPGAGAAGGVGGTLAAILDASLTAGIDLVLDSLDFSAKIADADLIITGEGKLDVQTAYGKTVKGIVQRAKAQAIPVIAFAGDIVSSPQVDALGLDGIYPINPPDFDLQEVLNPAVAKRNLYRAVRNYFLQKQ